MKITAISDTHKLHEQITLPDGDILIHCGDATNQGKYMESMDFIMWFNKQHYRYKILVSGNHDDAFLNHPDIQKLIHQLGIIILDNSTVEINGLKIYGNSYTPWFKYGQNQTLDKETDAWKDMPENLDILITHAPPQHILDMTSKGIAMGSVGLIERIKEIPPTVHVFGHIHEQAGKTAYAFGTKFYNAACVNLTHDVINPYTIIEEFEHV